jgi:Amt family ammonium transporter
MGNLENFGLMNGILGSCSPGFLLIPDLLYAFYQIEFACIAVGILVGGIGKRGRVLPAIVFTYWPLAEVSIAASPKNGRPVTAKI